MEVELSNSMFLMSGFNVFQIIMSTLDDVVFHHPYSFSGM